MKALYLRYCFGKVCILWRPYSMSKKPQPLNQLRSHSCFPDRLVILNHEDRTLSND